MATNKLSVTNFIAQNSLVLSDKVEVNFPANATRFANYPSSVVLLNNVFLCPVTNTGSIKNIDKILISTDYVNWSEKTLPISTLFSNSDNRQIISYTGTRHVIVTGDNASTDNRTIYSTDNGVTWSSGGNLTSSSEWSMLAYGTDRLMAINKDGTIVNISTNGGDTWSSVSAPYGASSTIVGLVFANNIWATVGLNLTSIKYSTNNGTTWNTSNTLPIAIKQLNVIDNIFYVTDANFNVYASIDCITWAHVLVLETTGEFRISKINSGYLAMLDSVRLYYSNNLSNWKRVNISGAGNGSTYTSGSNTLISTASGTFVQYINTQNISFVGFSGYDSGITKFWFTKGITSINTGDQSYIDVTATKGPITFSKRLIVKKAPYTPNIFTISASPGVFNLPATNDGIVTDYSGATITIKVYKNGIEDTINWGFSKSDSAGLTTSLSTNVITITALSTGTSIATITVVATKTGEASLTATINVGKNLSGISSGITSSANFSAFSTTQTSAYIKFLSTGYFQLKYGGGSYVNAGQWYTPPNAVSPPGGNFYIRMSYTSDTSDVLNNGTNGTLDTWSLLNVDREWYLSNAASGTHRVFLSILFATDSSGTNAVLGTGTLQVIVP